MSFKEIIAQDAAVAFLKAAVRSRRLAHAYLFIGPAGVGKKETAVNFAKLLLCASAQDEEPCDRCPTCVKVGGRNHPDVQWVAPDGPFIKIDAIREACLRLNMKGFESPKKVLVVADAHRLNDESANALLKTLEEPTPDTVLVLLTDDLRLILPTIASRCQKIFFSRLSGPVLENLLQSRFHLAAEEAAYLARLCEGSLGLALERHHTQLFVRKNRLLDAVLRPDVSLKEFLGGSSLSGGDEDARGDELLCVLASWFRDLLVAKTAPAMEDIINVDRRQEVAAASRRYSLEEIERRIAAIAEAAAGRERNINRRLSLANLRSDLWK